MPSRAPDRNTTLCSVDVVFGDDEHGAFTASILKLQLKNKRLRDLEGVLVLVREGSGAVVSITNTKCNVEAGGLRADDTGQC